MSVTTWTFLGVAFCPRVPVVLHSLRSPVSKSALKMTLAEAEPMTQNRLVEIIKGNEYLSGAFDDIRILRGKVSRLPVCHRGEESLCRMRQHSDTDSRG